MLTTGELLQRMPTSALVRVSSTGTADAPRTFVLDLSAEGRTWKASAKKAADAAMPTPPGPTGMAPIPLAPTAAIATATAPAQAASAPAAPKKAAPKKPASKPAVAPPVKSGP